MSPGAVELASLENGNGVCGVGRSHVENSRANVLSDEKFEGSDKRSIISLVLFTRAIVLCKSVISESLSGQAGHFPGPLESRNSN